MVGKTPLILAPIIVGGAFLFLAFWFGRWFERAGKRYEAQFIDPVLHQNLADFIARTLVPTDVDQVAYLPPEMKQQAERLLGRAKEAKGKQVRYERRRRGY